MTWIAHPICHQLCLAMSNLDTGFNSVTPTDASYHNMTLIECHDDFIKWKFFPCYWPFVRGIHRPPVSSPHKGQWRGALMFSLICAWINDWINNGEAGDLRGYRIHYDVNVLHCNIIMEQKWLKQFTDVIHVCITMCLVKGTDFIIGMEEYITNTTASYL